MIRSGMIAKNDYQKKLKPLLKYYGFITTNYTRFTLNEYRIIFDDSDKTNYQRQYSFEKIVKEGSGIINYYNGYRVTELIESIKVNLIHIDRKIKIGKILNDI